jgi:hypothetical protein
MSIFSRAPLPNALEFAFTFFVELKFDLCDVGGKQGKIDAHSVPMWHRAERLAFANSWALKRCAACDSELLVTDVLLIPPSALAADNAAVNK